MPEAEPAHESMEIRAGWVALAMGLFVLFIAASALGLRVLYVWLAPNDSFAPVKNFEGPQLLTNPDDARDPGLVVQRAELEAYRWIDRAHGVVQIPVARAMAWVAARGAQGYAPPPDSREATP